MEKKKLSKTKQKIKKSAIDLFNNSDTLSVTTNHIAKSANISPGNLYYHYKNKEDIIKDLYSDMSFSFENFNSFEIILNSDNPIKELDIMFDRYGELFWEYRFLMRDINTLMAIYPQLKEMFLKNQKKRITQIESLIRYFISLEIMENASIEDISLRARLNWFISSYWHFFAQTTGKNVKEAIQETKKIVFKINIYPYLTEKGKKMIEN
ncbi:TetR/AcrR family transcriptional regulator [Arcobacter sp. LA11]|uniref:TetR/AcrR family transcriptional regulator n=1 Tax=Arcobacter sp. LA11 TaxID=1898176 RepID=UPI000934AB00|nr:TetR/AcrR family transcriptional regulator [Arcobacter sp. LA11]